ncbi:class I SAM-dependent methyltransferase [bacterium]|nr:class I SAM-dependent methyltransferase [bacterium]
MEWHTSASFDADKERERIRYDQRAEHSLEHLATRSLASFGSAGIRLEFREPYADYERQILIRSHKGARVLDLCCGTGLLSLIALPSGAELFVADISEKNVELACFIAQKHGVIVNGKTADTESLPYPDKSFDLVTCAGSLSYFDHSKGLKEICRVLTDGGYFICVDSLNHHPIYRFNRWLHYLRKNRTLSTLLRMPTIKIFNEFEAYLGQVKYKKFFGIFSFLIPLLMPLCGPARTALVIKRLDRLFYFMSKYAFKFVAVVQKRGA